MFVFQVPLQFVFCNGMGNQQTNTEPAAGLEGYERTEVTIDAGKAQLQAILYALPLLVLLGGAYFLLWGASLGHIIDSFNIFGFIGGGLLVILLGIIAHELIHGITWAIYARSGFRSIRFGVMWAYLTPYCHCKEPLRLKHYITGALMPAIILGVVPCVVALINGSAAWLSVGLFFILAAGGDFMIVNLLRKKPMDSLVQDHSDKLGCYVYQVQTP